ncbi:hypothetical protein L0P88_04205 [Muricauda sp. SCSIO 64092]|uniref:hypothetical protein n=1 Tax=Allomuricauda sp. SCSIO 64092 TaxID=2908842 RepID=UPI001FF1038B|nr:hypothetical protein [Muricauda sp. SCSIO 64092]UOY07758.1 hypothetical protein L0P88_04205 [Muricauda sp. SCSIO 64092]
MTKGDIITDPKESFYRRAYRKDKKYVDPKTGNFISRAFTPRPKRDNGMLSVDLVRLTTPENTVMDADKFAIAEVQNSDIINLGLESIYDPVEANGLPENLAHCLICCIDEDDESIAGILARKSKRIYLAEGE